MPGSIRGKVGQIHTLLQEHLDHLILPNLYMFGNWSSSSRSRSVNRSVNDNARSLFQRSGVSTARYEAGVSGNLTEQTQPKAARKSLVKMGSDIFHFGGESTEALPPADVWESMQYWESNLLGNPRLPSSVKFLVGILSMKR